MSVHERRSTSSDFVVTAIVVSWNTCELLRGCLDNLVETARLLPMQIVVVDNASSDGSADMVAREFPQVTLVRHDANVGFGSGNNLGFPHATGRYLLLLNPDARLAAPDTLEAWVQAMESDAHIAISGAYLTDADGRHRLGDAGFRPTWRSMLGLYWFLGRFAPRWFPPYFLHGDATDAVDVDWVSGAAMLVRRSCVDSVGGFDERIFMYGEDVEWCCRMRDHGYRVVHLPSIRVTHFEGASGRKQKRPGYSFLWFRQMRALYFHYQPRQPAFVFDAILLLGLALRVAGYAVVSLRNRSEFARTRIGQHVSCISFLLQHFGRRGEPWPGGAATGPGPAAGKLQP